ncbi:MAG: hypothetical protein ACK6DY_13360 [Acidobacteriota bacterium]
MGTETLGVEAVEAGEEAEGVGFVEARDGMGEGPAIAGAGEGEAGGGFDLELLAVDSDLAGGGGF